MCRTRTIDDIEYDMATNDMEREAQHFFVGVGLNVQLKLERERGRQGASVGV